MTTRRQLVGTGLGALGVLALAPGRAVIAAEYLSVTDAQRALFPQAEHFDELALALSGDQRARVASLAGPQPPHRSIRIWRALGAGEGLGTVFVDEVIGREDYITYALGVDPAGRVRGLEVLAYRESHGGEIRNAAWRSQFAHQPPAALPQFRVDIKNIAGATLSCEHVTQGVRWLLAIWQIALAHPPEGR